MRKFKIGMQIIPRKGLSTKNVIEICKDYSTNPDLIRMLTEEAPLTILDVSEEGIRVEGYNGGAPWIPQRAVQVYGGILEEGEEL